MSVDVSTVAFTNQADTVPSVGTAELVNSGVADTLNGNDLLTGTSENSGIGFSNSGTFSAGSGKDVIRGYGNGNNPGATQEVAYGGIKRTGVGIINSSAGLITSGNGDDQISGTGIGGTIIRLRDQSEGFGISNAGDIETGSGNDKITGNGSGFIGQGISNRGTINVGAGDDSIIGIGTGGAVQSGYSNYIYAMGTGIYNDSNGIINLGNGNNTLIGYGYLEQSFGLDQTMHGIENFGLIEGGNGNDFVEGNFQYIGSFQAKPYSGSGVTNSGLIELKGGDDTLSSNSSISNGGTIDLGSGEDLISGLSVSNGGLIKTGSGDDRILSGTNGDGILINGGTIDTGSGNDLILGNDPSTVPTDLGPYYGIINSKFSTSSGLIMTGAGDDTIVGTGLTGIRNEGTIDTGTGNDQVIANGGFTGGGQVILGSGKDYLKGFGLGSFDGGKGYDTLELTQGVYTVGVSGSNISFTRSDIVMDTTGFEKLLAGDTSYAFNSLADGQIITIA